MVERSISATVEAHPKCGVSIWAPRRLRDITGFQMTTRWVNEHCEPIDKEAAVALDKLASRFAQDALRERKAGVRTLILSEENLMGGMRNNFRTGVFYPDVAQRLAAFDSLLPRSPKVVALGVRDYGAVWSSAYHYLPQVGQKPPPIDVIRHVLLDDKRGWIEVVAEIKRVWPDTEIVMWRQEDLETDLPTICGRVANLDPAMIVVPEGKINARKKSTPKPEIYSDFERKQLGHRYNRHIRRLMEDAAVSWVAA